MCFSIRLRASARRRVYSGVQFMIPFLHLGPITIPTFGLMVATALLVSAYVLQADFDRRRAQLQRLPGYQGQRDEGFLIIGVAGIAGLVGARLYNGREAPANSLPTRGTCCSAALASRGSAD